MVQSKPGIQPRPSPWSRLDAASRLLFPAVVTAVVLVILAAPWRLPGQAQLQPAWALACVFFWSVFRPASMPAWVVFLLGVLLDLLGAAPLGVGVLMLLVTHGIAVKLRRGLARQGFALVWLAFVAVAAGAAAAEWAVVSLLGWRLLPPWPALFEFLVSAGFYPCVAMLLTLAHRSAAAPEQA